MKNVQPAPLHCQCSNSCALLQQMLPLLHAKVPITAAKETVLMGQYACKWVTQPVFTATSSPQKAEPHVPTAVQPGGASVKVEVSPAILINQLLPCGAPLMPCWHTAVQCCCEQVIMRANIPKQQGHKARNNILQSLPSQPLARSQFLLQLTRVLVINPCNICAILLFFVLAM